MEPFSKKRRLSKMQKELEDRFSEGTEFEEVIGFKGNDFESKPMYLDKCVRIILPHQNFVGIYRGIADEGFVLFPTMNSNYHPELTELSEKDRNLYYWQEEFPVIVSGGYSVPAIFDFEDKDHLDSLVRRSREILGNRARNSEIIIPSEEMHLEAVKYFRRGLDKIRNSKSN